MVNFRLLDANSAQVDLAPDNDRVPARRATGNLKEPPAEVPFSFLRLVAHNLSTIGHELVRLIDFAPGEDWLVWGDWLKHELLG